MTSYLLLYPVIFVFVLLGHAQVAGQAYYSWGWLVVLVLTTGLVVLLTARTWSPRLLIAAVSVVVYLALEQ